MSRWTPRPLVRSSEGIICPRLQTVAGRGASHFGVDPSGDPRNNARVTRADGRRDQVLMLIRQSPVPLDDDQIAQAAQMNRVYVNTICRQLAQGAAAAAGRATG